MKKEFIDGEKEDGMKALTGAEPAIGIALAGLESGAT